jgi:hypothetical protein
MGGGGGGGEGVSSIAVYEKGGGEYQSLQCQYWPRQEKVNVEKWPLLD